MELWLRLGWAGLGLIQFVGAERLCDRAFCDCGCGFRASRALQYGIKHGGCGVHRALSRHRIVGPH